MFVPFLRFTIFVFLFVKSQTAVSEEFTVSCSSKNESWSTTENFVWTKLCSNGTVEFDMNLDQTFPTCEKDDNCLGRTFIRDIFRDYRWRNALPNEGLTIRGAWFPQGIDLEYTKFDRALRIEHSLIDGQANLIGLVSDNSISFEGSVFRDSSKIQSELDMRSVQIGGSVNLQGTRLKYAVLRFGKIGGNVWVSYCDRFKEDEITNVSGTLDVAFATIGGEFCIQKGDYNNVTLAGTQVGGQATFGDSRFRQRLQLYSIAVGSELVLGCSIFDKGISLRYADIGGWVLLAGSIINGSIDMTATNVRGPLAMASKKNETVIWLNKNDSRDFSKLPQNYCFNKIALLQKEQTFGQTPSNTEPSLILLNAKIETIQDYPGTEFKPWPLKLNLQGIRVNQFLNITPTNQQRTERDQTWYEDLLDRQSPYSRQPYQHIVEVLRRHGENDLAEEILYKLHDDERDANWKKGNHLKSSLQYFQMLIIGYGIGTKIFRVLIWMTAFAIFGTLLARFTPKGKAEGVPWAIFYSVDLLLPIIELNRLNYRCQLPKPITYYFYVHKIAGYLLAFFVIAGLSGLTS